MLTLFKCLTCDNWVDIMYDVINFEKEGKESIRNNTSMYNIQIYKENIDIYNSGKKIKYQNYFISILHLNNFK